MVARDVVDFNASGDQRFPQVRDVLVVFGLKENDATRIHLRSVRGLGKYIRFPNRERSGHTRREPLGQHEQSSDDGFKGIEQAFLFDEVHLYSGNEAWSLRTGNARQIQENGPFHLLSRFLQLLGYFIGDQAAERITSYVVRPAGLVGP